MKKLLFIFSSFLIIAACLVSCDFNEPTSQEETFGKEVADQKGDVFPSGTVLDLNHSSIRFDEAVKAYEAGNMKEVTKHLQAGANALVNEGRWLKGDARERLTDAIKMLEKTIGDIKNDTMKNSSEMEEAIAAAELSVAQEYVIDLNEYEVNIPLEETYYPHFTAAIKAVRGAESHLKGKAKMDAQKLVEESQHLIKQMNEGKNISEDLIVKHRKGLIAFLAEHHIAKK